MLYLLYTKGDDAAICRLTAFVYTKGSSLACTGYEDRMKGVCHMGCFGGYTRWAVVFLIIFVLFILFIPAGTGGGA